MGTETGPDGKSSLVRKGYLQYNVIRADAEKSSRFILNSAKPDMLMVEFFYFYLQIR